MALADLHHVPIRKIILIAPPVTMNLERMMNAFKSRPGTKIDMNSTSRIVRSDGSITLVPSKYFIERTMIQPMRLYNELAKVTELVIIRAKQDNVLGETEFSVLKNVRLIELDGDHEFSGDSRKGLLETVAKAIL